MTPKLPPAPADRITLPDGQRAVLTVFKDGTHKVWGARRAVMAQSHPLWLTTLTLDYLIAAANGAAKDGEYPPAPSGKGGG